MKMNLGKWLPAAALIAFASAPAAAVEFDFTTLGANNTQLGTSVTVNGVTATALRSTLLADTGKLWLRNVTNDHGLGVCDSSFEPCVSGGGDENELDNKDNQEFIILDKGTLNDWTSLWVSSLDGNGTGGGPETGGICWGNDLLGICTGASANLFAFAHGDGFLNGGVEGNLFDSAAFVAAFDASARYVVFFAGTIGGTGNNDYLVWKGSTAEVPAPAALLLLGLGLAGMGYTRRRS